jgi:hypothetical protein
MRVELDVLYGPDMNERTGPGRRVPLSAYSPVAAGSDPAVRDADAILARAKEDEAAALEARELYRDREISPIEPDARIAALLIPGEDVLAVRRSVLLDRREPPLGGTRCSCCHGLAGDLYVTSARLVLVGQTVLEYDHASISDIVVSAERLLLSLSDGSGITLDVDRPNVLRVEIGAARVSGAARTVTPGAGPVHDPR